MKHVTWAASATADLTRIRDHLSEYHALIAQDTIDRLVLAARWLLTTPGAGETVGLRNWRSWRPRRTRYVLIYEPTVEGISIVRVFHARQDWRAVID